MLVTERTIPPEDLTPIEVVKLARSCAPAIRERAVEAEKARRQPVETIQELTSSGLTRLLTPRRWGGYEMDFATAVEAVYEISKADASAGWCYSFLLVHNWFLAHYPDQAQHDVWADSPDVHLSDSFIPAGKVTRVEGGYRISGNWPFVSGIDHSSWVMLAGMMPEPATGPFDFGPHLFLLPRNDFAIEDTWFVAGLEASGSQNVVVEDAFVPAHRVVSMPALMEGVSPGAQLNTNLMYRQPLLLHFAFGLTAPIVGAVMGAYELWREMTRTKSTRLTGIPLTNFSHQQIRIAETSAEITTMQLLLEQNLEIARRENPTLEQRIQSKRNFSYVAHLAVQAIERIYITSGGAANYKNNPLQRFWRDIHAMAAHAALNWDTGGETFGLYEISQTRNPRDPFI
ncbi:MAG TPA: acyl-CoA dehydrogenase family protein [Ktedonobacteraceae bacterium]|jgi:3-hydroxy-9,10-secoandrosta-1,3,5(10)-triene-9,17-dione monooxygenase|nr:acyl-CoA dehydrogenase family protein [Ktedonobacteraceae bacterium]